MKITNSQKITGAMQAYGKSIKKMDKADKSIIPTDKIEISKEAREYQMALKALNKLPEVREDKVNELKSEIAEKKYSPESDDVLKKLLSRNI